MLPPRPSAEPAAPARLPGAGRASGAGQRGWLLASILAHLTLVAAMLLLASRAPREPEELPPPAFDIVFEGGQPERSAADPLPGVTLAPPPPPPASAPPVAMPPVPPAPPPPSAAPPAPAAVAPAPAQVAPAPPVVAPAPPVAVLPSTVPPPAAPPGPPASVAPPPPAEILPAAPPPALAVPPATVAPPAPPRIPAQPPRPPAAPPEPPPAAPQVTPEAAPPPPPPRPPLPQQAAPTRPPSPQPAEPQPQPAPRLPPGSLFLPDGLRLRRPAEPTPPAGRPEARGLDASVDPRFLEGRASPDPTVRVTGAQVGADWRAAFRRWLDENMHYPRRAIEFRESGTVRVQVTVEADGRVRSVRLTGPSASPSLNIGTTMPFNGAQLPAFPPPTDPNGVTIDLTVTYRLIMR